jgi:hypothetical protein
MTCKQMHIVKYHDINRLTLIERIEETRAVLEKLLTLLQSAQQETQIPYRRFRHGQAKCGPTPYHDKFTVLVLEMATELLSLKADGVLLGQKCPLLCRNSQPRRRASPFDQGN